MKIKDIITCSCYLTDGNIEKFYNLIMNIIDYLNINDFVKKVNFYDNLDNCFSQYNLNKKELNFGNNIFNSSNYLLNYSKAIVHILHEIIHVIQLKKVFNNDYDDIYSHEELKVLRESLFYNNINYSEILPLHEYQAFLNSNYILMDSVIDINGYEDIENIKYIIISLLYNNYYDKNLNYSSPVEQTANILKLNINYKCLLSKKESILNKICFGKPVEKSELVNCVKRIQKKKSLF